MHRGQRRAVVECVHTDGYDICGNGDALQLSATLKSVIADRIGIRRQNKRFKATAVERVFADTPTAVHVAKVKFFQAGTASERAVADSSKRFAAQEIRRGEIYRFQGEERRREIARARTLYDEYDATGCLCKTWLCRT